MYLVLLGAPGAGKGTQGPLLAKQLGVPKIATGDILRDAVRRGADLGAQAKAFMDAGELVPDDVILGLVADALLRAGDVRGAVFDGFPRTVPQALALQEMLAARGGRLEGVLVFEVADEVIVRRLSGRRSDPETGMVYHVENNPPPAEIAERLILRADDHPDTVQRRLREYHEKTQPLIAFYEWAGVPMHRIQADRPIEVVQREILSALDR